MTLQSPRTNVRSFAALLLAMALSAPAAVAGTDSGKAAPVPAASPASIVETSGSTVVLERDGRRYVVDLAAKTVEEVAGEAAGGATPAAGQSSSSSSSMQAQSQTQQATSASNAPPAAQENVFVPGDERVFTLPSGLRITKGQVSVDFTHRFPFSTAFTGRNRGQLLLGLDDFGVASFGFEYGITNRLSAAIYRSPSIIARPIELRAAYRLADEREGQPFNATFRFSVDGQNDFQRNFTPNLELIFSRSLRNRAQITLVPTMSFHNRPLAGPNGILADAPPFEPCGQALANGIPASLNIRPCANTFSLGTGLSVNIRPTVTLIAEVIPTLANARELGIHRPPFSFAIQKKIWRHAFTLGFTTAPGTTVAQRISTRSPFLFDPHGDTPAGLTIGFNLSRELK